MDKIEFIVTKKNKTEYELRNANETEKFKSMLKLAVNLIGAGFDITNMKPGEIVKITVERYSNAAAMERG